MTAEDDESERTLWCGNLADSVTEEHLYELFLQAGPLEKVRVATDKDGRRRGFAFVTFKHAASVPYTIQLMDGITLNKRALRLQSRTGSAHDLGRNTGPGPVSPQLHRSFSAPVVQDMNNMNMNMNMNMMQQQSLMFRPQINPFMMQPMANGTPVIMSQPRPLMSHNFYPPQPPHMVLQSQGEIDHPRGSPHGDEPRDSHDHRDRSPRSRDSDRSPHSRGEGSRDSDMRRGRDLNRESGSDYRRNRQQDSDMRRGQSHHERRYDRDNQSGGHHDSRRRDRDSHSHNRRDGQRR